MHHRDDRTGGEESSGEVSEVVHALEELSVLAAQLTMLKDYSVGARLNKNRPTLEQLSEAIIKKLAGDTLPGITPVKVTNLGTLRKAYMDANKAQGDAQADATGEREAVKAQVKSITDRRIQIQYAVDAEWPHTDRANRGIRRAFSCRSTRRSMGELKCGQQF
jgi:hypothetical protein